MIEFNAKPIKRTRDLMNQSINEQIRHVVAVELIKYMKWVEKTQRKWNELKIQFMD